METEESGLMSIVVNRRPKFWEMLKSSMIFGGTVSGSISVKPKPRTKLNFNFIKYFKPKSFEHLLICYLILQPWNIAVSYVSIVIFLRKDFKYLKIRINPICLLYLPGVENILKFQYIFLPRFVFGCP